MSVLGNVTLAPRRVLDLSKTEAEEQATALLGRFGLADKRDDYPDRLSGGQQQRVAIVRALAMRPELMAGTAGLADRLFGDEELTGAASGDVSFAVLHGLYWLAANLASQRPTAIVIDDLHWTDAPSLRWLTYLSRRLEGLPLLVVLGLRPPEQSVEKELLTELIADPSALVIRPTALGVPSVATMAREEFGLDPEDEFIVACHERCPVWQAAPPI